MKIPCGMARANILNSTVSGGVTVYFGTGVNPVNSPAQFFVAWGDELLAGGMVPTYNSECPEQGVLWFVDEAEADEKYKEIVRALGEPAAGVLVQPTENSEGAPLILVTGAAGKTGRAVIKALVRHGLKVRAFVRGEPQAETVKSLGAREVVIGDIETPDDYRKAAAGVQAIYHICPNVHPREKEIGLVAIGAARKVNVSRFVYHSVLHPQTEKMPHHWQKLRVEEMLFESGLNFTILQPAVYMQNILGGRESMVKEGVYRVPYPVETRLSLVDLEDVAETVATVLKEPGHDRAIYELSGSEAPTQTEIASAIAGVSGWQVRAEQVSIDSWRRQAGASGLGEYQIETLIKMFHYYARFGLQGNSNLLEWLLGRSPTALATFLARELPE
ncbi:MAG TPA: NmrA family NAD(P)-binding protein [Firmicutes bacterium]|nr:NmrA family NAD(P)-binding protein [Bacillota bacterium]